MLELEAVEVALGKGAPEVAAAGVYGLPFSLTVNPPTEKTVVCNCSAV